MKLLTKVIKVNNQIELKQIEKSDALQIFNLIDSQREYLGKWLPFVAHTKEVANTENFIKVIYSKSEHNYDIPFVIFYERKLVGLVGFKDTDVVNKKTEIGYWLSETYQKKGIITEAVNNLIYQAFSELSLNRIQIKCGVENCPSKAIPIKLGFKLEGIERAGELLSDDNYTDLEVYSLLSSDL